LEPNLEDVLKKMLMDLQSFVPAQGRNLPKPSLSLIRADVLGSGVGNYIGISAGVSMTTLEQHAIRVQAIARFSLWGVDEFSVDQATMALNSSVFAQRNSLQGKGFLKLAFESTGASEEVAQLSAWRRNADYNVLYEYPYEDTGGASSFIVRIHVHETAPEQRWTVSGDLARWDNKDAPPLSVRGPAVITGLAALAFFPSLVPTAPVRIMRTFDGAPPPVNSGTWDSFIAETTASTPSRNVYVVLVSVSAQLAFLKPDGPPFFLGDWNRDGVPDRYLPRRADFGSPIVLPTIADRLELSYQTPPFDRVAVLYIRASRQGG
jgi:hypothetical protein